MTAVPLPDRRGVDLPHPGGRPATPRPAPQGHRAPGQTARRLRAVLPSANPQVVPTWLYSLVAGLVLTVGVIGIVALNALAAEASFQARELEDQISDLTLQHDDLVAAVAVLEAPGRVREVAQGRLGLIVPEQPGFLTLEADDLIPAEPKPEIPPSIRQGE